MAWQMGNRFLSGLTGKRRAQTSSRLNPGSLSLSLLVVSVAVLIPSTVQAASFTSERAVIGLFRGAGGLLGSLSGDSGPSGIDILASRINTTFPNQNLTVQVFDAYQGTVFNFQEVGSPLGTAFLNQFNDVGAVGLIGYSGGGLSAIRTAKNQSPKPIDLLVQLDSYEPLTGSSQEDEVLSANVQTGINYYQRRNRYNFFRSGWDPTDLQGAKTVSGSQNINVEDLFRDRSITHRSIDDDTRLHNRILQDIATYVLPNLAAASFSTGLAEADAAPLSLLSLPALSSPALPAADLIGPAAGISAEPNSEAVPEPSLLLALGAMGGGLWLTKKQRQAESALTRRAT
ncbi:MAG: PEP-CTERM sorting domain-containing protein [Cyanobacteria bacterium P01_D01_bin.44]